MSRRPPDPRTLRVARSGQRMAPGGRRWSESPVPRVGKRRIRAVGAASTIVPPVLTGTTWDYLIEQPDSTVNICDDSYLNAAGGASLSITAGVGIAVVIQNSSLGTITPPSGWEIMSSGRNPGGSVQEHAILWTVCSGAGPIDVAMGVTDLAGDDPTSAVFWWTGCTGLDLGYSDWWSYIGTDVATMPTDVGDLMAPLNMALMQETSDGATASPHLTVTTGDAAHFRTIARYRDGLGYGVTISGQVDNDVRLPAVQPGIITSTDPLCDWFSMCIGWVPA